LKRSSLFRKYFSIFALCIVLSILVLGAVLLVFASQYFQNQHYAMLERNANFAAATTARNYEANDFGLIDIPVIDTAYSVLSFSVDAEIFLCNTEGVLLYSAGAQTEKAEGTVISQDIINRALTGKYSDTGTLGGFFPEAYYVVGVPVIGRGQPVGVLFAASNASSLTEFLIELAQMFLISAVVVLFISFVLIYFITSNLVKPLKEMLYATQSFSQGDFTKRVQVSGFDELGQLAMAFNNMASSLATTETTRRSFVANVSHELKTPMTTIGGFVDGILDGTIPPEKQNYYLQIVSSEVKRLSRLVRSMLDTARIEAGELQMNPTLFDISEIIRQSVFSLEQTIEEKRVRIEGLEIEKVMVWADMDLMHQVVYNLIENAVKFVNEDGVISFHYQQDAQRTYVAIRNTGEGIDKTEVPLLFERFYKRDKSRSLNKSGVGLGLHIVKSIINYHKGEIFVRSEEGQYTEFEFCIPNPPKKDKEKDKDKDKDKEKEQEKREKA